MNPGGSSLLHLSASIVNLLFPMINQFSTTGETFNIAKSTDLESYAWRTETTDSRI
jgi:hypothetical protein